MSIRNVTLLNETLTDYGQYRQEKQVNALCAYESIKVWEVALSNAVVDPWAVVVKSVNTAIAEVTVSASRCPDDHALRAQTACFKLVKHLHEIDTGVLLNKARVF